MSRESTFVLGAVLAAGAVVCGAFGAHALQGHLSPELQSAWRTATLYHMVHALALVAISGSRFAWTPALSRGCACLLAGVLAFSGSLYALALGGPRWLGPVTPLGGLAFVAGWLLIATAARSRRRAPTA